ncbi:MAG: pitrilysin family protein [Planctomycetota bacterium]
MPITFKQHTFPNGLTVLAEADPDAHTSAVGFYVKTGARDETAPLMGVSHFLEHMMFKGTARRSAEDVNREFDELGADYNAFTSHEQTVYYAHVLPEYLPRAVDLLGDMLRPALRTDDFDMEKKVILEEIGMYDDRPEWRLQDTLLESYFGQHPLGYRVLGTNDTITALTADQMRTYFEHRYSPDNIVVALAGKLDWDATLADLETLCGGWKPTGADRPPSDVPVQTHEQDMTDERVNRHYLATLLPAPSAQDELRYAARVLGDLIGDDDGSRLYWALIEPGLADEASFSFMPMDHAGAYMAFLTCDPDKAKPVEETLLAELAKVKDTLKAGEITRAVNKLATSVTLRGERPAGRMHRLGGEWLYRQRFIPLEDDLARLQAVTLDEVVAVLDAFPLEPRTTLRLGPT